MRTVIAMFGLALSIMSAHAQTPQKFIPFIVEEQDARNLRTYLDEQKMGISLPILQWMDNLEQKAIAKAKADADAAEAAKKAKEEPKPEPQADGK